MDSQLSSEKNDYRRIQFQPNQGWAIQVKIDLPMQFSFSGLSLSSQRWPLLLSLPMQRWS
jgi:hypothetical protein